MFLRVIPFVDSVFLGSSIFLDASSFISDVSFNSDVYKRQLLKYMLTLSLMTKVLSQNIYSF